MIFQIQDSVIAVPIFSFCMFFEKKPQFS